MEATFRKLRGVTSTAVGYCGGSTQNPTYEQVCSDRTGHLEAVQIEYDPLKVTYEQLLEVFWSSHNPTQVGGQGFDSGSQYRSVIFYHTPEQQVVAEASKAKLDRAARFRKPIATQVAPAPTFWRAEEYHQQYYEKAGCRV